MLENSCGHSKNTLDGHAPSILEMSPDLIQIGEKKEKEKAFTDLQIEELAGGCA